MKCLMDLKCKEDDGWLDLMVDSKTENENKLRKQKVLNKLSVNLKIRYLAYNKEIYNITNIPSTTVINSKYQKDILIKYYERAPTKLNNQIKKRRNDHGLDECPYCGYPFAPNTLDHFVPKGTWPEYSIYPNNLIPQCRQCASIKGTKYFCDVDNVCKFISPIYSSLLSLVTFIIRCKLQKKGTLNLIIKFEVEKRLTVDDKKRIKKHLKELNIKNRIWLYSNKEWLRLKRICTESNINLKLLLDARIEETKTDSKIIGDWKTALYKGLIEEKEVIDYLDELYTPRKDSHIDGTDREELDF